MSLKDAVQESAMMKRIPTILAITDEFKAQQKLKQLPGGSILEALTDRLRYMHVTQRTHFGGGLESIYTDLNNLGASDTGSPRPSVDSAEDERDEVMDMLQQVEVFSWLPPKVGGSFAFGAFCFACCHGA